MKFLPLSTMKSIGEPYQNTHFNTIESTALIAVIIFNGPVCVLWNYLSEMIDLQYCVLFDLRSKVLDEMRTYAELYFEARDKLET